MRDDVWMKAERLARVENGFTASKLAGWLGVKLPTAWKHCQRLVKLGYVQRDGRGRGTRYVLPRFDAQRASYSSDPWVRLRAEFPRLAYVELFPLAKRFHTRQQVHDILDPFIIGYGHDVVDFARVESAQVSDAFLDELINEFSGWSGKHPIVINLCDALVRRVQHVRATQS